MYLITVPAMHTSVLKLVYLHSGVLRLSANRVTILRRKSFLYMATCYSYCMYSINARVVDHTKGHVAYCMCLWKRNTGD